MYFSFMMAFYILIWLWALYSTGGDLMSVKTPKRQLAVEYSSLWLETAAVAAFPVVDELQTPYTLETTLSTCA